MSKETKRSSPAKQMSAETFYTRHGIALDVRGNVNTAINLLTSVEHPAFQVPISANRIRQWWLFRALADAAAENSPDAFSAMLQLWLVNLGILPPRGVFVEKDLGHLLRSKRRSSWLEQRIAEKDWDSDMEIARARGPAYNTIQRYRSGEKSTRDLYVRRLLSKVFNCHISLVPK